MDNSENDVKQAQLLDTYWATLQDQPDETLPRDLDPEVAAVISRLELEMKPPEPDTGFAMALHKKLDHEATNLKRSDLARQVDAPRKGTHFAAPGRRLWPAGVAAVMAVLLVAITAISLWAAQPAAVSAAEVVKKAQDAAANTATSRITNFEMVEKSTWAHPKGTADSGSSTTHVWYRAPGEWRYEISRLQGDVSTSYITVADQRNVWKYDSLQNSVQVTEGPMEAEDLAGSGASSLKDALQKASTCYNPRLAGEQQVAGRAAYVVEMGATTCPSASMPDDNGPLTFWLDKETYFVLKSVLRDTAGTHTIATTEVSSIAYNQGVANSVFTFTPPAGATVADTRPRPTVDPQAFAEQLGALAKQADFPLFAPSFIPGDLQALQPQLDPQNGLAIEYTAPSETQANSTAGQGSVSITERKATYAMVARWTEQADPVPMSASRAWLQRSSGNSDEKPSVLVLRDGTFVAITGASSEDLMKVASSLVSVPGGHAPIAEPIPPTLSEVRGTVSFPVFVPTDLPEGFVADPPLGGEQAEDRVEISYRTRDGAQALLVINGPAGCCLDAGGLSTGTSEAVQLANGTNAHYLPGVPESGGPILWWEQDGSYVALSGPAQTRESLLQIASSMSKTASLGR
ncbi:MAG TPA: hypothetical protein VLQ48_12970 [Chloroflexia bacterium]|nr:hypothetical protein [Chloroflexia bacterium]